jgi:aminoglycoside phosphotransferase (APT) family kinase protein
MSDPTVPGAAEAQDLAATVLQHLLGERPEHVEPLGGGLSNLVFEARRPDGDLVVRIATEPFGLARFLKQQWATARVAEEDVPVPRILEVGTEPIGMPYMVSRKVAGTPGTHHPERFRILREMGRLARRVHRVRTEGFGHSFGWSGNQLSRRVSWGDYLARDFRCRPRLELLARHGMLTERAVRVLEATLDEVERRTPESALTHGDLRLKNVLADEAGAVVALIDWDECTGNDAPAWDLAVALHDLSVDAKEEFVAGYGLSPREIIGLAPTLRLFNVLHYANEVERAAEEEDRAALERLRARLHGALDLYPS